MENPSIKLGDGNWSAKDSKLLGFRPIVNKVAPIEFDVARASTATRVNRDGLIESVANNIARVDFADNVNGALLLEPQGTNLVTYSEDFSNSAWDKVLGGVAYAPVLTANQGIAPDGTLTADRIIFDLNGGTTISDFSRLRFVNLTATNPLISIYIKSNTENTNQLSLSYGGDSVFLVNAIPNEWTRVDKLTNASGSFDFRLELRGTQTSDNFADILIWGAQAEESSVETSYIPTSGTTVTRLADVVGGAGDVNTFNSLEGTLFCNIAALADDLSNRYIGLYVDPYNSNNRINIYYNAVSNNINGFVRVNGVTKIAEGTLAAQGIKEFNKCAITWSDGYYSFYVNGVNIGTNNNSGVFAENTLAKLEFYLANSANNPFYGKTKDLRVYNRALTDSELTQLTTI